MIKQVIVMRKDLNMRKGKMIAQGCHASMKVFLDRPRFIFNRFLLAIAITKEMNDWVNGLFTKICVSVDSEQELKDIYNKAKKAGLPCALIEDAGLTEFKQPTLTCCAIGPASEEKIDPITGNLKLL